MKHYFVVYRDSYMSEPCHQTGSPSTLRVDRSSRYGERLVTIGVDVFEHQHEARRVAAENYKRGERSA
jgi:hypothetical protein